MMAVVAIVALNAAVARALFAYDPETLIGITLTGLALQGAVLRLVGRRHSNRAFWISFAVLGSLAMASFVWGRILPTELIAVAYPGKPPRLVNVSRVSALWLGYGRYVGECIEPWLVKVPIATGPDGIVAVVVRAVVWSLPQLLVALVGGLVAWGISKMVKSRLGLLRESPRGAAAQRGAVAESARRPTSFADHKRGGSIVVSGD